MPPDRPKREGIMLCYPAEPSRIKKMAKQVLVQPKLNGERCRVEWFHGTPILMSSYGNQFSYLDHIQEQLCLLDPSKSIPFDGELYVHGWPRERIHSACSRKVNENVDCKRLQLHLFDIQWEDRSQASRILDLISLHNKATDIPAIKTVPTFVIQSDKWITPLNIFFDDGYEGIILRDPAACYIKKRTTAMLKYKPTELDEYTIIGVNEAISIDGDKKGMVGAFLVTSDEGTVFEVGAGKLPHSRRIQAWDDRDSLPTMKLRVKHEKIRTINDVPVAAVAVDIVGYQWL